MDEVTVTADTALSEEELDEIYGGTGTVVCTACDCCIES